ncbi:hypothetical protein GCM10020295_83460 [Streptomyces cinereospinus]
MQAPPERPEGGLSGQITRGPRRSPKALVAGLVSRVPNVVGPGISSMKNLLMPGPYPVFRRLAALWGAAPAFR